MNARIKLAMVTAAKADARRALVLLDGAGWREAQRLIYTYVQLLQTAGKNTRGLNIVVETRQQIEARAGPEASLTSGWCSELAVCAALLNWPLYKCIHRLIRHGLKQCSIVCIRTSPPKC